MNYNSINNHFKENDLVQVVTSEGNGVVGILKEVDEETTYIEFIQESNKALYALYGNMTPDNSDGILIENKLITNVMKLRRPEVSVNNASKH